MGDSSAGGRVSELADKLKARAKELDSPRYYHGERTLLRFAIEVLREVSSSEALDLADELEEK